MKKLLISAAMLVASTTAIAAPTSKAGGFSLQPYVTAGYSFAQAMLRTTDRSTGYPTAGMPKSFSMPFLGFGFSVSKHFGLELGYTFRGKATKGIYTAYYKNVHADVVGNYAFLHNKLVALGMVGAAIGSTPQSHYTVAGTKVAVGSDDALSLRIGLGVQYNFIKQLGLRAMVKYGFSDSSSVSGSLVETVGLVYYV